MSSMARTSLDTPMSSMRSLSSISHIGRSKGVLLRFQNNTVSLWIWVALQRTVAPARDNQHVEIALLRCRWVLLKVDFSFQTRQMLMAVYRLCLAQARMRPIVTLAMMMLRSHSMSWPLMIETSSSGTLREAQAQMSLATPTTQHKDHQVSSPAGLTCLSTQPPGGQSAS